MSHVEIHGAVEPVDRAVHRIQKQRDQRRRNRPFPSVRDDEPADEPEETEREPRKPRPDADTDENDEHRIDVVVCGLPLPTRQIFPPTGPHSTLH